MGLDGVRYATLFLVLALLCAISQNADGSDVDVKVNHGYNVDYVIQELATQRLDIERQKIQLEKQEIKLEKQRSKIEKQTAELEKLRAVQTSRGSSYIRWGRTTCSGDATLIYRGYVAGAKYNDKGSGSNRLCLHERPQWKRKIPGVQYFTCSIYGAEYEMWNANSVFSLTNNAGEPLVNHPTPCAHCYTPQRSTNIMIPARTECPAGWTKEYQGYIVADHHLHQKSTFSCMDDAPETGTGGSSRDQSRIYPVEVVCGSLPCSRYPSGHELTCVVCSK